MVEAQQIKNKVTNFFIQIFITHNTNPKQWRVTISVWVFSIIYSQMINNSMSNKSWSFTSACRLACNLIPDASYITCQTFMWLSHNLQKMHEWSKKYHVIMEYRNKSNGTKCFSSSIQK